MKKVLSLVCSAVLICTLAGCSSNMHDGIYGDDAAIAGADAYSTVGFTSRPEDEYGYDFLAAQFSGAETLWYHEAAGGEVFAISATLEETNGGEAKLVMVDPAGALTALAEASSAEDAGEYGAVAEPGLYRLKLVGRGSPKLAGRLEYSLGTPGSNER